MAEKQFVIPNYLGGIHEEVDSSLLKSNEASKAQNCNIDKGILKSCNGLTYVYTTNNIVPKALMTYYKSGENNLIAVWNGILQKWNGNGWTQIGSGLNTLVDRYDFINDNVDDKDVLVFTNQYDNVKIYDGTTMRDLKRLGKNSAASSDNTIKGKYTLMHNERLWIMDDNSAYGSSVTRDGFDIEDFTTPTDEVEVNMHGFEISFYGSDGKIIGAKVVFDDVIIFKEKSIHKIFGSDPSNYTKINFSAKGGISDKSIAVHETGAYFIDHSGIYHYDGTSVVYISRSIEDTWKSLNPDVLNVAVGFINNDKYVVAVREGESSENNLIIEYDIANKNFMFKRGFTINSAVDFNRKTLITTSLDGVYEYNSGVDFDGNDVEVFWETGYTDLGLPEATKEFSDLYISGSGSATLNITLTTENGDKEVTVTLNENDRVYPINLVHRGRMFKIKIHSLSGYFSLKSFKLLYELDVD